MLRYLQSLGPIGTIILLTLFGNTAYAQLSTEDHLADPGFWPTQPQASRDAFVGSGACATCHADKLASQRETPMGQTAMPASIAKILHAQPVLRFDIGKFKYRVDTNKITSTYSITDGSNKLSYPLSWAFGTGRVAQSYLFKKEDGAFYEARATYFTSLKNLDFTPDRALKSPHDLEEAMYRPVSNAEVERCFACHSTASTIAGQFDEKHLVPGVTCEACHGPGAKHVSAMNNLALGNPSSSDSAIYNSGHLSPSEAVEFCGSCHGSFWDVKLAKVTGPSTTRSAPYRLVTSKCWGQKGDSRLTCSACHDPHQQLQTSSRAYDGKCLSCHVNGPSAKPTALHPGAACPKAQAECTSCHMPKVNVPEMHADFTDHRIRIAKTGEPFPE